MEEIILEKINEAIKQNKGCCLVSVVDSKGSSPGKIGFMMGVFDDKSTVGTVGGGEVENLIIENALKCIDEGKDTLLSFDLNDKGDIHMQCGGSITVFIKTFKRYDKLLIAGGGHVSKAIYELAKNLKFKIVIFEDREEYGNLDRFPNCEIVLGDIGESIKNYPVDDRCYIIIVTRGHMQDEKALKASINRGAAYVGMIGSIKKTDYIMQKLLNEGYSKEDLEKVYAPIGLCLGGDNVEEIALSILSEIMLVKNNGELKHMKDKNKF